MLYIHSYTMSFTVLGKGGNMPVDEDYYSKCLALPMFPTLTEEEQNWVVEKVKKFIDKEV